MLVSESTTSRTREGRFPFPALVVVVILCALAWPGHAAAQAPDEAGAAEPRVVVMVLPDFTAPKELASLDDAAFGLLSGGIGAVPGSQAFLDIGQGSRLNSSLYDGDVPLFLVDPEEGVRPPQWQRALDRVADAPADLIPGLLASTLADAGIPSQATARAATAAVIAADRDGRVEMRAECETCPGLTVTRGDVDAAARVADSLREGDLLIAFERPPAEDDRQLAIAIVGLGSGTLESASTRIDGLVLTTDLAPTILDHYGLGIPDEMNGRVIEVDGEPDLDAVAALDDRLSAVSPRRGEAVGFALLGWTALTALAGLALRSRGLRIALPLLALSFVYLPTVLLLTAALEPSETVERLIAWLAPPALAFATLRLSSGWRALGVACAVTVAAHALDVVVGSPLTRFSLLGPNPALGVRFYGIGNELEATLVALVLIGAGAALTGFRPDASTRARVVAFAAAALVTIAAFAPGRFGADVGAAIGIPAGAAVAAAILLGGGWRRTFGILAAPVGALALIALLDLALGGDAHLSRSVLEAGGLDEVGQVAERRLRLCAASFARYGTSPALWATTALIVAGIVWRHRIASWFEGAPAAWAGWVGAVAATVVGTLANDSGALLLMIGTALTSLSAGYAWALHFRRV